MMPLLLLMLVNLAACNTWSGFGKDVQQVGRKMEDAGDRRKD
jgi:predicted small secreted protein